VVQRPHPVRTLVSGILGCLKQFVDGPYGPIVPTYGDYPPPPESLMPEEREWGAGNPGGFDEQEHAEYALTSVENLGIAELPQAIQATAMTFGDFIKQFNIEIEYSDLAYSLDSEGYFVVFDDDNKGWITKESFEENYGQVKPTIN